MATELAALPEDDLANVLRRLPPRHLAVARSVCEPWRAIIDGRALMPPRVHGIFINYVDHDRPHLFSRPAATAATSSSPAMVVDGLLDFLPSDLTRDWWSVLDYCNGLLLCHVRWETDLCVCNPATRRWTLLPGNPTAGGGPYAGAYLAFDPAVSPHYEVVLVPVVPEKPPKTEEERLSSMTRRSAIGTSFWIGERPDYQKDDGVDPSNKTSLMEWPPKTWNMNVFSSRTGWWEERVFARDGDPAGLVKDMWMDPAEPTWLGPRRRYGVYFEGALYVHCRGNFVARLSLSDSKYQVIKLPVKVERAKPYLGRSEMGVYFGIVGECQIQVWILTESCGNVEWVLKYKDDLRYFAKYIGSLYKNGKPIGGPWTVEEDSTEMDDNTERKRLEWDSDNDDILDLKIEDEEYCWERLEILGFHPYKEVVYLSSPFTVATYNLNSSKAQYLGNSRPAGYYRGISNGIYESFVYTPSMIGELHGGNTAKTKLFRNNACKG